MSFGLEDKAFAISEEPKQQKELKMNQDIVDKLLKELGA